MKRLNQILQSALARGTSFIFEIKGVTAVIAFRLIILWLILFFTIYNKTLIALNDQIRFTPFLWVMGAAIAHLASNIFLALSAQKFVKRNVFFIVFLFDIALISFVIYLTQGFESDLFLIYFLVIFMTVLARKPFATFAVAGVGSLVYGFMFLKGHSVSELMSSPILIRFPLFLVAAVFSHIISKDIEGPGLDIKTSDQILRQITDNIREVFWMTNAEKTKMLYVSPGYERIWGRPCESIYASPLVWIEAVHPDDKQRVMEAALKKQTAGFYSELYRIVRPDGSIRWIRDRAFPIEDESGKIYRIAGIAEDVTTLKEAEDVIRKVAETKSRFAATVSHELRAPLAVMKSGIGMLMDGSGGPTTEKQKERLEVLKRNVDRLHRLVNDILDYAKLQSKRVSFKFEEGDLNATVKEVCDVHKKISEDKKITLKAFYDPRLEKLGFDPEKIIQVLNNLVGNAIKFTDRGEVRIMTSLDQKTESALIKIKDTGIGIQAEDLPKLFHEFQQVGQDSAERKTKGTGLGLAICKEIVLGHGGRIWAESKFGAGSEFAFSLPLRDRSKVY